MQGAGNRERRAAWCGLFLLVAFLWLGGVALGAAAPVTVTTRVEPDTVGVGTPFRYFVRVETTGEAEVVMPLLVERIGEFMIRDFGSGAEEQKDDGFVSERWYELVGYSTGPKLVEGGVIQYRVAGGGLEEVEVPDAVITIASMLDQGTDLVTADIRDIRGPVGVPRSRGPIWLVLAGLALAALVVYLLARWTRSGVGTAAVVRRPAHEVALESLTRLRRAALLESGRQPEFYVRLSGIVREYVEGRFQVRAPEMTTEEFLQAAQSKRELPAEYRSGLSEFLREADLVKFARHLPTVEQGEKAFEAAREFVIANRRGGGGARCGCMILSRSRCWCCCRCCGAGRAGRRRR